MENKIISINVAATFVYHYFKLNSTNSIAQLVIDGKRDGIDLSDFFVLNILVR